MRKKLKDTQRKGTMQSCRSRNREAIEAVRQRKDQKVFSSKGSRCRFAIIADRVQSNRYLLLKNPQDNPAAMVVLCAESSSSSHWSLHKLILRQPESISVLEIRFLLPSICISQDHSRKLKATQLGLRKYLKTLFTRMQAGLREGRKNTEALKNQPRAEKTREGNGVTGVQKRLEP